MENSLFKSGPNGKNKSFGIGVRRAVNPGVGNFRELRNASHIRQEMQTMAFHIKDVRHDYAHKQTKAIVDADPATLQYHMDTLSRFREGLDEVLQVNKVNPTAVATKKA